MPTSYVGGSLLNYKPSYSPGQVVGGNLVSGLNASLNYTPPSAPGSAPGSAPAPTYGPPSPAPVFGPPSPAPSQILPINVPPATSGGGYGVTGAQQSAFDLQQRQIEESRARLQSAILRYNDFFDLQQKQLNQQQQLENQTLNQNRGDYQTQYDQGVQTLNTNNTANQATTNKTAQASGIFDSSARLGAIGNLEQQFHQALGSMDQQKASYFSALDSQLQQLSQKYEMSRAQLKFNQSDTADQIAEKQAALDSAQADLQSRIASIHQAAIAQAQTNKNQSSKFFQDLATTANSLQNFSPELQTKAISELAGTYGVDPKAAIQQFNISQALTAMRDKNANQNSQSYQQYKKYLTDLYGPNYETALGLGG